MPRDGSLPPGCKDLADTLKKVRVIGKAGKNLGIMTLAKAIKLADVEDAEMVEIARSLKPPVYRLVDPDWHRKRVVKKLRGNPNR